MKIAVVLLAGGQGTRMNAPLPKQYLPLNEKPVARHSFDLFLSIEEVCEIAVVCEPAYRHLFHTTLKPITFAPPGKRRQDSVYSGFQALTSAPDLVCVHDSARPQISAELVKRVFAAAKEHGAATVGMPIRFTVKECDEQQMVVRTPDREKVWEIQTPQVLEYRLLEKGFTLVHEKGLTVTDDVSIAELLGHPVKLVEGSTGNIKITTPEDYQLLQLMLK